MTHILNNYLSIILIFTQILIIIIFVGLHFKVKIQNLLFFIMYSIVSFATFLDRRQILVNMENQVQKLQEEYKKQLFEFQQEVNSLKIEINNIALDKVTIQEVPVDTSFFLKKHEAFYNSLYGYLESPYFKIALTACIIISGIILLERTDAVKTVVKGVTDCINKENKELFDSYTNAYNAGYADAEALWNWIWNWSSETNNKFDKGPNIDELPKSDLVKEMEAKFKSPEDLPEDLAKECMDFVNRVL